MIADAKNLLRQFDRKKLRRTENLTSSRCQREVIFPPIERRTNLSWPQIVKQERRNELRKLSEVSPKKINLRSRGCSTGAQA